jgi:hypothetical protein
MSPITSTCGIGADVDHLGAALGHEEGRLLDDVVADVDDQVRRLDRAVDEVARRQRRAAEELGMGLVDHPLAELGGDEGDPGLLDQLEKHPAGHLAVRPGADDEQRRSRRLDLPNRRVHRFLVGGRPADEAPVKRPSLRLLLGDILGEFEVHRPGLLLLGEPEGLPNPARYVVGRRELVGEFGDRPHHRDHVEDLEPALLRFLDRLLAGDHQDRHSAELGISGGGDEVGRSGPEGGEAHTGLAGMAPIGRRHEARPLLVAGEDQPDPRARQAVEEVEILLARDSEDIVDAFFLQALDEQVGGLGHSAVLSGGNGSIPVWRGCHLRPNPLERPGVFGT